MEPTDAFFVKVLKQELSRRVQKNPRYSLRAMAQALDLDAGSLSQILSGKRIPSYKMSQRILAGLELTPQEENQFQLALASAHQSRGLERISPQFRNQALVRKPVDIDIDLFKIVGDWQHYAILFLTLVEGFQSDAGWIAKQLNLSLEDVQMAIDRLVRSDLLKFENGRLICWDSNFTTSSKHVTTGALRRHQRQILEKSIEALENVPIENRSHTSMTMAIDPDKIQEAKLLIEEFTGKLSSLLESGKRTQVYELSIGLFPLQLTETTKTTDVLEAI